MNKTKFAEILGALKAEHKLQYNIGKLMREARDNVKNDFMNVGSLMICNEDIVIDLLEELVGDIFGTITWWIYETNFGEERTKIYDGIDNEIADIKTAEDLYDYIQNNKE